MQCFYKKCRISRERGWGNWYIYWNTVCLLSHDHLCFSAAISHQILLLSQSQPVTITRGRFLHLLCILIACLYFTPNFDWTSRPLKVPPAILSFQKIQILFVTTLIILLRVQKILNRNLILFLPVFCKKTSTIIQISSTCLSLHCKRNYNSITIESILS